MLYPVNLVVKGQHCLVVGGGEVAARKVRSLLTCGANVTVAAPQLHPHLLEDVRKKRIRWTRHTFRSTDLKRQFLVIAATDTHALNTKISAAARRYRILVNAVDQPKDCTFTVPSVVRRGSLAIAISTNGASPALSKQIRRQLSKQYGPEFGRFLKRMAEVRKDALKEISSPAHRKRYFEKMVTNFFNKHATYKAQRAR